MVISRRYFLRTAGAVSLGFAGLHRFLDPGEVYADLVDWGYGALVSDPEKLLDLPQGFSYQIISQIGEEMDDGLLVPGAHDGMAAFPGPNGKTLVVRNHEVNVGSDIMGPFGEDNRLFEKVKTDRVYDQGKKGYRCPGGTTTLVFDTKMQRLESHFMSLAGTLRNCAGGPTPWNSWVTCEETVTRAGDYTHKDHGYNFEVPARADGELVNAVPLKAMGRFNHEAIAVDPKSGIVYETEDRSDGLIYRFIPKIPGQLAMGGKLQALAIRDQVGMDTRNWEETTMTLGQSLAVKWINLENVEAPEDDLRHQGDDKGASLFARGEGIWYGNDAVYIACTNGGLAKKGQIWKYVPSPYEGTGEEEKQPGMLTLFSEPNDGKLVENADNLTIAPWGDVIACEDGKDHDRLVGITPEGKIYTLANNARNNSELAGVSFAPDGSTMFVNIQTLGYTLAVTGPWRKS